MRVPVKIAGRCGAAAVVAASLAGCSATSPGLSGGPTPVDPQTVTVVTHDSFAVPDDVLAAFETESGIEVTFVAPGDTGILVNQLVLTKDSPIGDVVYGVDNTFATRAAAAGVFSPYRSSAPAADDAGRFALEGAPELTAIDFSDVCLNYDLATFEGGDVAPPQTLDDLLDPAYRNMLSVSSPATSSPGMAFLLTTIAAKGDAWPAYWAALADNGLRVTASWSDTYFTDFAAPNYGGDRPIVLSYASSPPSEVIDGHPTTAALLDTCFRQVEYAGVLAGARNPEAAGKVIDWMLSDDFQAALPESMYVYPVSSDVEVPEDWREFAPLAPNPWGMSPETVDAHREQWLDEWRRVVQP